ncbi:sigma-70 family RNA polymerase sigma factor [Candidatus Amarobacter glycogenicus]|uniref:RNA polymerase sigma factor n=1 Tax=Candidatus Amarobacter glycogenicus TaxID=3140699 RepID=UPI00313618DE|nr:sigma-70 family RNA polymerase sigma factor [Dehalococcoidia bacterium]
MTAPAASLFDEATLVRQAQGGDREAFAQLYDRYFERIYDFVRRTLRNEADAADVTQEVFIKAMASISTLSNPGVFKSWLFTVARNLSISRIRGARQVLSLDYAETDEPEATLSELVPDTDIAGAPEEAAERSELAAMVWAVAAGLDARQYTVLDLSVRQELDAAEMAEVLGVTRNNAYVMVNRTKAAFSESAGDYFIYRDGVQNCPGLREELARANIKAFSPEARKAIERHLKHCPRCGEKKKRLPMPLAMFSGLALAAPPEGLRERIRTSLVEWPGGLPPDAGGTGVPVVARPERSRCSQLPPSGGCCWRRCRVLQPSASSMTTTIRRRSNRPPQRRRRQHPRPPRPRAAAPARRERRPETRPGPHPPRPPARRLPSQRLGPRRTRPRPRSRLPP